MSCGERWHLSIGVLRHCWDEECVVYEPRSGGTHLISSFAAALLEHLATQQGVDAQRIAQHLDDWFDAEVLEDERAALITANLIEMQRLGLTHPFLPC